MDLTELEARISALPGEIVDQVMLTRVGLKGVAIIRKRTESGVFLPGSSANAENYSTTPMPLPYGKLRGKLSGKKAKEEGFRVFTSKSGRVWIVLPGGYKQYRQLYGKAADKVTLSWSGRMLRNLKLISASGDTAELGFDDAEEDRIASYHNTLGAGKSRRKHVFMGFTEGEEEQLTAETVKQLEGKLKVIFGE